MRAAEQIPQNHRTRLVRVVSWPTRKFKGKRQNVTVTLPADLVGVVDALVEQTGWTRSVAIEHLCQKGLEAADAEEAQRTGRDADSGGTASDE